MPLWRREEPVHEKLAREGGLREPQEPLRTLGLRESLVGIHGVHRAREWDVVTTADAPGLATDRIVFVALPDSTLLIEEGPDGELEPFTAAVEAALDPPYRVEGIRKEGNGFAVAARAIEVLELPEVAERVEEVTLSVRDGEHQLLIDGLPSDGTVAGLEAHAGSFHPSFAAHATRLDGDLWEVRISPL